MSLRIAARLAARPAAMPFARVGALSARHYSNQVDPKVKATSILDSIPGNNVLSKTGVLATGVLGSIYAISNELYIVNDESIVLGVFAAFVVVVAKLGGPAYTSWADGYIENMRSILNTTRDKHTDAVKERIGDVSKLKDVVQTTQDLFAVSKDTVKLEAEVFETKQKVVLAAEAKSVLDSWVRYENSVRQREQKLLAETVISKIEKDLKDPKFQQQILKQSVEDIEKLFAKA
ncbi:ATP synthase subunit 4 [Yarrowia sp. C11]|nr:ATP synthase subunit 4 [Yarrowia sp. C11]KAG5364170.1 ATP synthase subunit 4 [Yarrowia sp. E02]